jgi:hypothetical protein
MATGTEGAWAAGLFEGEGYLYVDVPLKTAQPQIGLNMTDRDVVERFMAAVGCGTIRIHVPPNPRHSVTYRWRATGWANEAVIALLRPYLGQRRLGKVTVFEEALRESMVPRQRVSARQREYLTNA